MQTTETTTDPRVTELTKILRGVGGAPAIADLLKIIAPTEPAVEAPTEVPSAPVVTDDERKALIDFPSLFGAVVTTEPRSLVEAEVNALMRERLALDAIENLAKRRKEAIRTIVFNHFDSSIEGTTPVDAKGHRLTEGTVDAPAVGKRFAREIAQATRFIGVEGLAQLVALDLLTHDDFLAMTRPVRVVDNEKIVSLLRKRPQLAPVLAKAVTVGGKVAKFAIRPMKKG